MRPVLRIVVSLLGLVGLARIADACPIAVALDGDADTVQAVREHLTARGIATDTLTCPGVRMHLARRDAQLVIGFVGPGGIPLERTVTDPVTAATVIESFVRVDMGSPLLARRAVAPVETPTITPPPPVTRDRQGVHLFGSFDTAAGSDRTGWIGMQIGACVMLGPLCPAARFRFDAVLLPPGWDAATTRNSAELVVGIDVPLPARSWTVVPGIAFGMGGMRTDYEPAGGTAIKRETTGMRGELHASLLVPVGDSLSLDLSLAGVLLQEIEIDEGAMTALPRDPLLVFRFGVGLRYARP